MASIPRDYTGRTFQQSESEEIITVSESEQDDIDEDDEDDEDDHLIYIGDGEAESPLDIGSQFSGFGPRWLGMPPGWDAEHEDNGLGNKFSIHYSLYNL